MKVEVKTQNPITDEGVKEATGKTWAEWFAAIDEKDGLKIGRRQITSWLYDELKIDIWWCSTINMEYENHKGVKEKDGRSKGYFICSTKTIAAPVEKVYEAWASAAALNSWFGEGNTGDVADGGMLTNTDGDRLEFKRVRPNKDLRFTYERDDVQPTLVDVQFSDKGNGKTGLLVNHDRLQARDEADGIREAWSAALDRLKKVCEG